MDWSLNWLQPYQPILLSASKAWTSLGSINFSFPLAAARSFKGRFPWKISLPAQLNSRSVLPIQTVSIQEGLLWQQELECLFHDCKKEAHGGLPSFNQNYFVPSFIFQEGLFASSNFNFLIAFPTQCHNPPFVTSQLIVVEIIKMSQTEDYNFR